jgi:hypothetical protein
MFAWTSYFFLTNGYVLHVYLAMWLSYFCTGDTGFQGTISNNVMGSDIFVSSVKNILTSSLPLYV